MAVERRTDPHRHRLDWPELLHLLLLALLASLLLPAVASALRPVGVAAAGKSVEWANFDVTLDVHGNGETHVAERQVIDFSGGPWSGGFRNIPMARIDTLNDVTVSQVVNGATREYQYVPKGQYDERAGTYTYRVSNDDTLMIQWGFPKISNQTLTFLVEYDVDGVIMSYPDATPPYQQLSWVAVDRDLSSVAPVRNASLTMHFPAAIDPAKAQVNPRDDPANHTKDGTTWTWSKANLSSGEVFGAAVRFPPMLSVAPPSWQSSSDTAERDAAAFDQQRAIFNAIAVGLALLLLVLGGIGAYLLWNTQGKDPVVAPIASSTTICWAPSAANASASHVAAPGPDATNSTLRRDGSAAAWGLARRSGLATAWAMAARLAAEFGEGRSVASRPVLLNIAPIAMISGLAQLSYNDAWRRDDKEIPSSRRPGASIAGNATTSRTLERGTINDANRLPRLRQRHQRRHDAWRPDRRRRRPRDGASGHRLAWTAELPARRPRNEEVRLPRHAAHGRA